MNNGNDSFWVNDVSPNGLTSLRVRFAQGSVCTIDFATHLGDEAFQQTFPTYSYFLNYRISDEGGLTWPNGFGLSGDALRQIGEGQRE